MHWSGSGREIVSVPGGVGEKGQTLVGSDDGKAPSQPSRPRCAALLPANLCSSFPSHAIENEEHDKKEGRLFNYYH